MALCQDGRLVCLPCARYYTFNLTEDRVGPYTPEDSYRNLTEFVETTLSKEARSEHRHASRSEPKESNG